MLNQLKSILLLGFLTALLVGLGSVLAPGNTYLFLGIGLVMNLVMWFFSDKMALAASRAKPLADGQLPHLRRMVEDLSRAAQIPTPRIYVIPSEQPNAFATGRNPQHSAVAVTEGILQILDERELRGVIAHELSHIKNRDVLIACIAAAIASAISSLSHIGLFFGGSRDRDNQGAAILMAILAPIGAMLIQMGISRSREYLADETGAYISGDPRALASALGKLHSMSRRVPLQTSPATASLFIVNPFGGMGRSLANMFSTHPPIEERIRRLEELAQSLRGVAH